MDCPSNLVNMMYSTEYLADVDRKEQANKENSKADQLFKEGSQAAKTVVDLLTSINKKEQLPLYYAGGFRVITTHLDSGKYVV